MSEVIETAETAQDTVLEAVESKEVGEQHPRWHKQVALTTLVMALLAALGALLAGRTANEALLGRTAEIIEMSRLEGDRLSVETLKSKHEILLALGETPDQAEVKRIKAFEAEMRELDTEAACEEALALSSASAHQILAIGVTMLSLGITLGGMAIVVERKYLWYVGLVFGALGILTVGIGVLPMLV
jgi:hypothetical protein